MGTQNNLIQWTHVICLYWCQKNTIVWHQRAEWWTPTSFSSCQEILDLSQPRLAAKLQYPWYIYVCKYIYIYTLLNYHNIIYDIYIFLEGFPLLNKAFKGKPSCWEDFRISLAKLLLLEDLLHIKFPSQPQIIFLFSQCLKLLRRSSALQGRLTNNAWDSQLHISLSCCCHEHSTGHWWLYSL